MHTAVSIVLDDLADTFCPGKKQGTEYPKHALVRSLIAVMRELETIRGYLSRVGRGAVFSAALASESLSRVRSRQHCDKSVETCHLYDNI